MGTRRATHQGTWYSEDGRTLSSQLESWLSKVNPVCRPAKAIIAPHAGYNYCGSCGAYAYKQIDPSKIKRIFILGPSHHVYLSGCALSKLSVYNTPLYNLMVDTQVVQELKDTKQFEEMSNSTDEDEHSIELHLPYIAKVMESKRDQFTIVPILVGSLTAEKEVKYGKILSKHLAKQENLFVISSDFCHWGRRFRYSFHDAKRYKYVYQSIEALDKKGMSFIEKLDPEGFVKYLGDYGNTICGRHPIGVLLNAVQELRKMNGITQNWAFEFLQYSQSNRCMDSSDSSVSYAAGVLYEKRSLPRQ